MTLDPQPPPIPIETWNRLVVGRMILTIIEIPLNMYLC